MTQQPYQVLARKWRPRSFDEMIGQAAIVRTLRNALAQERVAHAYCFSGIRGVGKTTTARLLAKGLNCHAATAPTDEPCGRCDSCTEIDSGGSLDVVEMDAASRRGVDEIRGLNEFARYTPSRDRFKVLILDEAHMLTKEAFNALLKTLEEPPPALVFVLATTEAHRFPPTVLSRCQHYQFGRISQRDIAGHLRRMADVEGIMISDDSLALLATAADGSLRDGQSLLDKVIAFGGDEVDEEAVVGLVGLADRVLLSQAIDLVGDGDLPGVLRFINDLVERGVDLHQFTIDLLGQIRNLLVVRVVEDAAEILHLPEADLRGLEKQAQRFSIEDLDRAFALLARSEYQIRTAEQPRYHLEMLLARLAQLPNLEPLESLIAEFRGEGGGGPEGGRPRPAPANTGAAAASGVQSSLIDPPRDAAASEVQPSLIDPLQDAADPAASDTDDPAVSHTGAPAASDTGAPADAASENPPAQNLVDIEPPSVELDFRPKRAAAGSPDAHGSGTDSGKPESDADSLWQRAHEDPVVQSFVTALKGEITDVEEL